MEKRNKNYWRPLWNGLVMDSEGKHFRRMRSSVWLFLYLVLKANAETGFLTKNYRAISKETGIKAKTIRNWMANLKSKGYISTKKQNRGLLIYVKKWKTFKHQSAAPDETAQKGSHIDNKNAQIQSDSLPKFGRLENLKVGKIFYLREKTKQRDQSNIYDMKKLNNDINNDGSSSHNEFNSLFLTKEELLARGLAEGLEDTANLGFYISATRKYPEDFLREIYKHVKGIPLNKIKKSRGALFNYLIQKYDKKNHRH